VNIAIVGCGYVADMYMQSLRGYPALTLLGVYDRDPARLEAFTRFHTVPAYPTLAALLDDSKVQLVVNLTNPGSHHEVSLAALNAGRHVYSEKPLAMTMEHAEELVAVAAARGLSLAAAPCNHLSDMVRTLAAEIESGRLGRVVLAQAEMDDGMVSGLDYATWRNPSGAPWPARDEFEVGCTMEHAGYQISPLVMLFGPVRRVTAFNACLLPEKGREIGVSVISPDLSIGMLEFDGGIVARLTNSIVAPADRSLRVVGTAGVAVLSDVWEYHARLSVSATGPRFWPKLARKIEKRLSAYAPRLLLGRGVRALPGARVQKTSGGHHMDFARGIAQLAAQVTAGAPRLVGSELALHVTEVTLALQSPTAGAGVQVMRTTLGAGA
jgi:predicted dehydrogenase